VRVYLESTQKSRTVAGRRSARTIGGSGVDQKNELPPHIEAMAPDYTLYGIDYGWGYLMRGCIRTNVECPECVVPGKEGKAREVASISDLVNPASARKRPFVVLLDNEFFWKEKWAIARLDEFTERVASIGAPRKG
jgi:hypothetical protein